MEPNIQNTPNSTPTQTPVTDLKPSKSKALTAITTFAIILAVIGTSFGIYGMFFAQKQEPDTVECISDNPDGDGTTTNTTNSPSVSEVAKLLEEKYDFGEEESTFTDSLPVHLNDFDINSKIIFTINHSEEKFPKKDCSISDSICTQTISYQDFDNQFKYYFGNDANLEKKDYEFKATGLIKMSYSADNDSFIVQHRDGIGGTTSYYQYNKVVDVKGSEEAFYAIVASVTINKIATQKASEFLRTSSNGEEEFYNIDIPDDDIQSMKESLNAYKFNFVKEDGEYKLTSIEKA